MNDVTKLISSIVPPGRRENIKSNFFFTWDPKSFKKKPKKRKKRVTTNDKLLKDLTLPRLGISYSDMLPVHNLWLQYMENVLSDYLGKKLPDVHDPGYDNFSLILMRADYNGAKLKVIRSKCSSLIGKTGILTMETKETLKVLQENNELISKCSYWRPYNKYMIDYKSTTISLFQQYRKTSPCFSCESTIFC